MWYFDDYGSSNVFSEKIFVMFDIFDFSGIVKFSEMDNYLFGIFMLVEVGIVVRYIDIDGK